MPTPFVSKRAPIYADVPDEKWNDWRWQLSHRLNTVEDIEKVIPLTDSERKALQTQGLFRVDVTPTRTTQTTRPVNRSSRAPKR